MSINESKPQDIIEPLNFKTDDPFAEKVFNYLVCEKNETKKKCEKKKTKKQKRCGHKDCRVKLTLTSNKCKCGIKFCMKHFHFDKHNCQFDYAKNAREILQKQNVLGGGQYDKVGDRL